jgi:hypothetical protein
VRGIAMAATLMLLAAGGLIGPGRATAQELAPRAYWPAPRGTNVLSLAYQYSSGDVVIDPTVPLEGVKAKIHVAQAAYAHTFGFLGRTSSLQLSLPYTWADGQGYYLGQPVSRKVDGWADARLRFAVNLIGAPAMNREEFRALVRNPVPQLGFSLLLQAPTGQYDPAYLVNPGTNRWGVKPALGAIYAFGGSWALEFELGGWFFTANDDYQGKRRLQNAILSTEAHLVKYFRRGIWASLDANFFTGGRTQVDGTLNRDLQRNTRVGATVLVPLGHHALRASYSAGTMTETGGDYDVVSLVYVYIW